MTSSSCNLTHVPAQRYFELVALRPWSSEATPHEWPATPGAVRRTVSGAADILHFAPRRWLLPGPHEALLRRLNAAVGAGSAVLVDVSGKWCELRLKGAEAVRCLSRTLDLRQVFRAHECASVTLFDCPAVVSREREEEFTLFVRSSYYATLRTAIEAVARPGGHGLVAPACPPKHNLDARGLHV